MGFGRGKGFSPVYPTPTPSGGFIFDESGHLSKDGNDWDVVHDAATGTPYEGAERMYTVTRVTAGGVYHCYRCALRWNTASIPNTATIKAATLSLYAYAVTVTGTHHLYIVSGEDLGDTMDITDYGNLLAHVTPLAPIVSVADLTLDAYNNFILNAAGLALISKTGWTKFGIRVSDDINDVLPVIGVNTVIVDMGGENNITGQPRLVVSYE
uniref:Uncharacterized protein n=1 Tax=viral metagenome TaxID=1070528 RepID=A0A6M3XS40_9ZZZZ